MMSFAVCSEKIPKEATSELYRLGYGVITLPPHPSLKDAVACHADMIFSALDGDVFFDRIYMETYPDTVGSIVSAGGFRLILTEDLEGVYPRDCAHNALIGERVVAARLDAVSQEIKGAAMESGRALVDVRQGYAACSCLLANDALVTADEGIARALAPYCGVLKIAPGSVILDPYDTGFIGGASGFDGLAAYFVGDISTHPDGERIISHLAAYGVAVRSLCGGELYDIGGIKFI